ncbi:MAG TPA: MFS transporter [Devosia sp.]|nr:MFS transporter [Devosia sp.]
MVSTGRAEGFSPELRASFFHFTVFASTGAASAYLPIWLNGKGISFEQIGIINAVPLLLTLLTGVLIGQLADRASDWRAAIIWMSCVAGVSSIGLAVAGDFWPILIVLTLATYPAMALVPVVDAATLRMTERRGTDFSLVRAWGTVGYMATAGLTGVAIAIFGPIVFVPFFVGLALLRAVLAFLLPRFRAPDHVATKARSGGPKLIALLKPWFVLPCIAFALIQSTHMFLGSMGALVWKIDGISDGWFGPLVAISAAGEALMMFAWRRVGKTLSARMMIIIACLVATVRWTVMAFAPSLPLLFVLQAAHAITFPFAYFGIMHFIGRWAPEEIAAEAQGFSSALTMGVTVVTLVAFGWLIGPLGGQTYLAAAAMTLVGAGAAWLSLAMQPAHGRMEARAHG